MRTPLMLGGFIAAFFFYLARQVIAKATVSARSSTAIVQQVLRYFFILSVVAVILGFVGWVFSLWIKRPPGGERATVKQYEIQVFPRYGVSEEKFQKLAEENAVNKAALVRFFESMGEKNVPAEEVPEKLAEFSRRYKELAAQIRASPVSSPSEKQLQSQAIAAVEKGDLDKARRIAAALPQAPTNLRIVP
jgi:hypothetical protein